jgi:branched-chain amino acid transport system permease protein
VLGAAFLIVLPQLISLAKDYLPANVAGSGLQAVVFGLVLIVFIIFEPLGLYGRWLKVRTWFELFPFYRRGLFRRQKSYMKSERLRMSFFKVKDLGHPLRRRGRRGQRSASR